METGPPEKRLKVAPFSVQATRGLLRARKHRRFIMAASTIVAVVLLLGGLTILRSPLDPHEHPWRFVLYWLLCGWMTVLSVLLALFDLLLTRAEGRASARALREQAARDLPRPD